MMKPAAHSEVEKAALISPCRAYRYWLARHWQPGAVRLPIIMLNPSTADAETDDATIRRCMAYASRENYGGIHVINLFAFRTVSPAKMKEAADPVGPDNNRHTLDVLRGAQAQNLPVLCAWGAHGNFKGRAAWVIGMATMIGTRLVALNRNADGTPAHPLYQKRDAPFRPFP